MEKLQIWGLSDNDFEAAIIKILKQALLNSTETSEAIETISKEIDVIFKKKTK